MYSNSFYGYTSPSSPPPHRVKLHVYVEVLSILMICFIEMLFAIINMDSQVCHSEDDDLIKPQVWLITISSLEVVLLTSTILCECCNNTYIVVTNWVLAFFYMVWIFIGTNMAWQECLEGEDIVGAFFVGFSLLAGIFISYRNLIIVDVFYTKRVEGESNHLHVPLYQAYRV